MPDARPLPPILPTPTSAHRQDGSFRFADDVPIVLPPGSDATNFATARALQADVQQRAEVSLPIESHRLSQAPGPHVALVRAEEADALPSEEAYRLEVRADRIEVRAASSTGLRWGVETLRQLIDARGRVPCCTVEDTPGIARRGIMLDVSRGKVPTPRTVREIIDFCARTKQNTLMLYTEHTFRFRRHPKIGADDSPLDAESMRDLDAYAAENCVELVPCLQSLGHMAHVLKHPEYAHLDETSDGWTLSPEEPGTYELLEDVYDEYLPNFRSDWLNANCDEPWDLCRGKSKAREAELGGGGVYLAHIARLKALAARNGKRLMIWGDVVHAHPERIPEIDRDLVLLDWWYEADFDFDRVKVFADNGITFWVCPGTSSWNCLFPRVETSNRNIARWADAGRRHGAAGFLNTDWGDYGHYNLQGNSWFAYAYGAEQSWSGVGSERDFDRAFSRLFAGDASGEIARIYRDLGAVHDLGWRLFNGSPIQCVFFDELERALFVAQCKRTALKKSERALDRVQKRLERAREKFGDAQELTAREITYALEASQLAVRKAAAGLDYLDWRRKPESLGARERKKLARALVRLADEQTALGKTLRRLWLARSAVSNLDHNERRLRKSVKSLRAAARALEGNRPSEPPAPGKLSTMDALRAVRSSYER